ncbi:LysR family transcriptional regulator [Acuticoccus sp. MNP-M23]|uniref:LysR family transcriptional regulator n=1 Tax=Acuticoccus sp. MNP-M23 TaxID=3072793 RepID=UPI00281587DC|nr:LysR family transcriptional regulator [Acuticoccus sp. MNP-M23]WMS43950.1 LysR family transcriptional regulator [Acuticoccus sp. MNP-M23]
MPDLNYHHLRYFRAVAREGNLTRTAKLLNVSQSALSVQIRQLEQRLGHPLFERSGRQLSLTEAGRLALDHADAIFATGEQLVAALRHADYVRPTVRIGALATLSRNFVLGAVRPLLGTGVDVVLRSGTAEELLGRLEGLSLDLIMLNQPPGDEAGKDLISHRLAEQEASLIGALAFVSEAGSLADRLSSQPLIVPTMQSGIRVGFDALVARLGITPRIAVEADDMAMVRLLAREGAGLAVIPPIVVKDEIAAGSLVEVCRLPGIVETFYAVTKPRRFQHPAIETLLENAGGDVAPGAPAAAGRDTEVASPGP